MKKYTIEQVTQDLKDEFKTLSRKKYSEVGDANIEEYGGVKYRKSGDLIEVKIYQGLDNIQYNDCKEENLIRTTINIDELIEQLDEVWEFADGKNCGFCIGWLISSAHQYNGFGGPNY